MFLGQRNPDGTITIPVAIDTPDMIADGVMTIGPNDARYPEWDAYLDASAEGSRTGRQGRRADG